MIETPYYIILIIGDSVLSCGFELGDEVLDVFGVENYFYNVDLTKTLSCITDMNYE